MNKISIILKIFISFAIIGTTSLLALIASRSLSAENGFTEDLLMFIESHSRKSEGQTSIQKIEKTIVLDEEPGKSYSEYQKGDWNKYVIMPRYSITEEESSGKLYYQDTEEMNMNTYGSYKFDIIYGKSAFTKSKYRRSDEDKPVSKIINDGLDFQRQLQLHMEGNMGKRMKVYIDYDSEKEDNRYMMQYKAKDDSEVIREMNAGEIDIKFEGSKYAVYDDTDSKGLGMDLTLQKNDLKVKVFGSIFKGETEIEIFRGGSSSGYIKLADYQYIKNTYYQLEPYKRYDNLSVPPVAGDDPYNRLITFTSSPSDPLNYKPWMVNISTSGFELYMDDQNPYNNLNAITLGLDGGKYDRLVSGSDYVINYSTGLITLLKIIPKNARIFAVYSLMNGSSSDPAVRTNVTNFNGKNFVFIKYDYSINEDINKNFIRDMTEDKNSDERLNLDIYEVRSFFNIGQKQLLENNFKIQFYKQNGVMTRNDSSTIGKFSVDYSNGLLMFHLREPFRELYDAAGNKNSADILYCENPPVNSDNYSKYNIKIDYYREARSFQLKYINIIPGSERIKINGRELPASQYTLDYSSGFLQFTDPNNPAIGTETYIEIKYEYMPLGSPTSSLSSGIRTDYKIHKNLNIGGTVLYTRQSTSEIIPKVGNEPQQTLVLETDSTLHMSESSLKDLIEGIFGYSPRSLPLEINAYAEYAKSYKKINTFGKALIDDMESNEEIISLSLSDKDWQLASMPYEMGEIAQIRRGQLNYYYYKDPNNPSTLYGPGFTPYAIPYSLKPGPYNIATGHIADSIQDLDTQKSLAFNYNFLSGQDYIPVVTRELSREAVDFSQLQYIEIWYKSEGGAGQVELYFDLGTLNEDSDGDVRLDNEDQNINGILDFDPSKNFSEDVGYTFNPSGGTATKIGSGPGLNSYTIGDGYLNSEDLNHNGILDTQENSIRMPGPATNISSLVVNMSDTSWKRARIYLNKSSTDYLSNYYKYEDLLKKVQSVRFYLKNSGSATTGTIFIDSIKFISTVWGNIMLNDKPKNSPEEFSLTLVDTINDEEYRQNSFMISEKGTYDSLYGDSTNEELATQKETSIQIDYDLTVEKKGSTTKRFQKPIDMRSYKTMNLWLNYRSFTPGDNIVILVGSSDTDYLEYRFPMDYQNIWRQMSLRLKDNSSGNIAKYGVTGSPDMKRISFIRLQINGQAAGRIWLNDIYLSEAETQVDSAYWYEGEVKFKRPLYYTSAGTPVFSDINLKYIRKGHGAQFSTIGKPISDIMENYNEIFSSMNILPNWDTKLDFILEKSSTDSFNEEVSEDKRGKTNKKTLLFESNYNSNIYALPSIMLAYKQDIYSNIKEEDMTSRIEKKTKDRIYTPSIILDEKLTDFIGGNLSGTIKIDLSFKNEEINRDYSVNPLLEDEKEKRQKGVSTISLNYQNKYFFIQPAILYGSQEIVQAKGKASFNDTQILTDFDSSFHLPFIYNKEYKFVDREKKANLNIGAGQGLTLSPNMALEFDYSENNFRDYSEAEKILSGEFLRAKNAGSSISNVLNLPFNLGNFNNLNFLKSVNISYSRSIYFQETEVPYEGEDTGAFDENYGISRVYNGFANPTINLFRYPPWYFFSGRGNFARGRDFTYYKMNKKIYSRNDSPVENYTNQLRLIDNAGLNSMIDLEMFIINLNGGINQVSERQSLYGIPQEVVSVNTNFNLTFDLMRIFSFSFFRPNRIGIPYHSASFDIGYDFTRNMLITSNIEENIHSPKLGLTFKRDRSSLGLKTEVNFRRRNKREYISLDESKRSSEDDIYISNMQGMESFREKDKGYKFSILYETDILWMYNLFARLYTLVGYPIFSIEYSLLLDRYDYSKTASPEPYDQHLLTGKLTLDLHKNIQGGLTGRVALERFRDRQTNNINREIKSYEIAINLSLLF